MESILELLLHIVHSLTLLAANIIIIIIILITIITTHLPTFIMEFWSARLLSAIMEVLARLVTLITIKINFLVNTKDCENHL